MIRECFSSLREPTVRIDHSELPTIRVAVITVDFEDLNYVERINRVVSLVDQNMPGLLDRFSVRFDVYTPQDWAEFNR